jgi:Lon protease-like protein
MTVETATRLAIFPLSGAVLFPRMQLPLHIFEPRYQAMISESLSRDRRIGMIQPKAEATRKNGAPPLFDMGCVGKIAQVEAMDDGRYNIVLEGVARFRVLRELTVDTPFRQVEAAIITEDDIHEALGLAERASLEREAKRFADAQGYMVDWEAVSQLDDEALVNGIAQVAPFDPAAKQALLEAANLSDRAELSVQLMQFFGRHDGEDRVTLQ